MDALKGLAWLLLAQSAGEALTRLAGLTLPGPVLGLLLLLPALHFDAVRRPVGAAADALLAHLSLLFVPAGVGVMVHAGRLADEWLPISVALVASTALTIAVTALVMRALVRRSQASGTA